MMLRKKTLIGVILIGVSSHVVFGQSEICHYRCRDLTEDELRLKGIRFVDENLFINEEILDNNEVPLLTFSEIPDRYLEIHRHTQNNSVTTCQTIHQQIATGHRHIHLCPSLRMVNYDKNRIPKSFNERHCLCSRCQGSRSRGSGCQPVFRNKKVLRRIRCERGVYKYAVVMEAFSHGCECQQFSGTVQRLQMEE